MMLHTPQITQITTIMLRTINDNLESHLLASYYTPHFTAVKSYVNNSITKSDA